MKILCVHQGHELYGSDRSFISSLEALLTEYPNAEITAVIPRKGTLYDALKKLIKDVRITEIGTIQKKDLRHPLSSLIRIFKASNNARKMIKKYDFIYVNTIVILAFNIALLFTKNNAVVHVREIPSTFATFIFSSIFFFNRAFLIFNSKSSKDNFFFTGRDRSAVVLNGVDAGKAATVKKQSDHFIILVIGRLIPWKGQELLIEAFHKLTLSHSNLKLWIAGGPPRGREEFSSYLNNLIARLGLEDNIEMLGFVNDTNELYIKSNLVIIPSLKPEPFGRVAIEAMSYGCPIVAARHGGLTEILEDNDGGTLFDPGSVEDLVKKISLFITNKKFQLTQSKKAKERYKRKFTIAIYKKNFLSAIEPTIKKIHYTS